MIRRFCKVATRTVKLCFIVLFIYLITLCFREQRIPGAWAEKSFAWVLPTNCVVSIEAVDFGFRRGLTVHNLRVFDALRTSDLKPVAAADTISIRPLLRRVTIVGAKYPRLPDSYYHSQTSAPRRTSAFRPPELGAWHLTLVKPEILGLKPDAVTAELRIIPQSILIESAHFDWLSASGATAVDGNCEVDFVAGEVRGAVGGTARQSQIRPLIETLDAPSALPYIDAFTGVEAPVPAQCSWKADFAGRDFQLELDLHPGVLRYREVPMKHADGHISVHCTNGEDGFAYLTVIGPVEAADPQDRPLNGTVAIAGTNGIVDIAIEAKSDLDLDDISRIAGYELPHFEELAPGNGEGRFHFRFPRSMGEILSLLNGDGHVVIHNGRLMDIHLFAGLTRVMAEKVPGVSYLVEQSEAEADYVIEDGVFKTDGIYVEGGLFSIKIYGQYDLERDELDFTARVQFTRKDSLLAKLIHPITWPFTKLLLEFRLTGPLATAEWKYVSVLDRVLEVAK